MAKVFKLLLWHVRSAYLFNTTCNLLSISIGYLLPGTSQEKPRDNGDFRAMPLLQIDSVLRDDFSLRQSTSAR